MLRIDEILKKAVQLEASDLHIVIGKPPIFRILGELVPMPGAEPVCEESAKSLIYSMLNESQRMKLEQNWEIDCSLGLQNVARFRANVFTQVNGVEAALRIIPSKIPTPEEIGLTPAMTALADLPHGLVLITGPTGSGKSTTIASLLELINKREACNILTIEDPIEFTYENKMSIFRQREVGQNTKSFANALRSALREDPDVILVGEMRDLETIQLALTAAETGHLCFATLHTQDAPSAIDRIIDVFPPHQQDQIRVQLAGTLQAVIAQNLMTRRDGKSRIAAREFMAVTPAIANLIREKKTFMIYNAIETGGKFGMISMDKALANMAKQGIISQEQALLKARSVDSLKQLIGGARCE